MDTSDSECFESADEDFLSDNEVAEKQSTSKTLGPKDLGKNIEINLDKLTLDLEEKPKSDLSCKSSVVHSNQVEDSRHNNQVADKLSKNNSSTLTADKRSKSANKNNEFLTDLSIKTQNSDNLAENKTCKSVSPKPKFDNIPGDKQHRNEEGQSLLDNQVQKLEELCKKHLSPDSEYERKYAVHSIKCDLDANAENLSTEKKCHIVSSSPKLKDAIGDVQNSKILKENQKSVCFNNDNDHNKNIVDTIKNDLHRNELDNHESDAKLFKNQDINITKETDPKTEEENLWDDDELDWGSEAAKESQATEPSCSLNSKNEDSGWDDFDADWESESTQVTDLANKKSTLTDSKKLPSKNQQSANLWEDDDGWEPLEKPAPQTQNKPEIEEDSSWGAWGSWGVTSILNTATQSVSTITTHVSQGISNVLESGIGIPDPEEMARLNKIKSEEEQEEQTKEKSIDDPSLAPVSFGIGNLVSGVSQLTKFVESTGTKVITGGLDTLEAIGKKTVEVLQEGDPGLKKKRAFLKLDSGKPNLSQILREAKEKAEEENEEHTKKYTETRRFKNYETLFDDHQGLVHLEALEMLSKLCNIKLDNIRRSLSADALKDLLETLEQVNELCELPDDDEENKLSLVDAKEIIDNAVKEINIPISYEKLYAVCNDTDEWLRSIKLNLVDNIELHQQAIDTLAQVTSLAVEQFHKAAELLLVKEHRSTADEADSLVQITTTVKSLIHQEAAKFTEKLSTVEAEDKDKISEQITNIFYEAANSGTYIQDAFQLLIPVLQVGAV